MPDASSSLLFFHSEENGLLGPLLRGRAAERRWRKVRGTPAAWIILGMELMIAHGTRLFFDMLILGCVGLALGKDGSTDDICRAIGSFLSGLLILYCVAKTLDAPSLLRLFAMRLPSWAALAFFSVELLAIFTGYRLAQWQSAGGARCLRAICATPFFEELYFRVSLLHLINNRFRSLGATSASAALLFAFAHSAESFLARFTQFLAGWSLSLRFIASDRNLLEVLVFHMLHNGAAVATLVDVSDQGNVAKAPETLAGHLAPLLLFGSLAAFDAVQLGVARDAVAGLRTLASRGPPPSEKAK